MILFLEGQASQREVVQGARLALPKSITVFASHHQDRPEITGQADVAWREPNGAAERVDWALHMATTHGISVVHAGRKADVYETRRSDFANAGIDLVTGARSLATFDVEDKSYFVAECERARLRCVPAITVSDENELASAYAKQSAVGEVCVKPATGIYGQGFWRLIDGLDPFRCMAHPDDRQVNAEAFIRLYGAAESKGPLLVMPYMNGDECSVDIVCEDGVPVAWVSRRKTGLFQVFERDGEAVELALATVRHFRCDGIVNVQTINDAAGVPHLLEINLRYSGGLSYTTLSGLNLPGIFATRRLNAPEPESKWVEGLRIKPTTGAVPA